jgi:DNA-binding transcriptional LysR family regulator
MSALPTILKSKRRKGAIQKIEHGVQPAEHHLISPSFLNDVHWNDLHLFKTVASAGSLRKAAQRLGIAVNTVRARVSRLEDTLKTVLFRRGRDGLTLSEEGSRILEVALEMQVISGRIRTGEEHGALVRPGELKISSSEGVGEFWLTPRLSHLQERLPGIVVSLHNDFDQHRIHTERHDIALSFSRARDPDMVVSRIATLHFALYASERYLSRFGEPRSLNEAANHRLVIQDAPGLNADSLKLFVGEMEASRLAIVKVNTSYSLYWAVANGVGIGALPTYVRAISRNVRPLDLPVQLRFDLWLSYHRSARTAPAVRIAVDWLREAFDTTRYPWFSEWFIHPNEFENLLQDAAVHALFPLGEQPRDSGGDTSTPA